MADDLAHHPDGCCCATHASIRRFMFDHEPAHHPDVVAIPPHSVNRVLRNIARGLEGHLVDPTGSGRGRWVPDDRAMWSDDGTGAKRKDHLR